MIVEGFMKEATFDLSLGIVWSSLGAQTVESAHNVEDPVLIPELKRSLRKWQPTPVFLPGKSHGWRSLVVYSP